MLRDVKSTQRLIRMLAFRVDGSDVAGGTLTKNGLLEGTFDALITENSAGNYTLTFAKPFARVPVVTSMTATDVSTLRIIAVSASSVQIEQVAADQTTPLADGDFHLLVLGFDAADQV